MKKKLAPAALALLAAVSTAAVVATHPERATAQPPPPNPRPSCFWTRSVTNFAAVDTNTLYVRAAGRQVWALSLFSNCFQLNWVHRVALRSRGSSNVCEGGNPGLDVVIHDVAVGRQSCPVTSVRKLTPDEVAALPPQARP